MSRRHHCATGEPLIGHEVARLVPIVKHSRIDPSIGVVKMIQVPMPPVTRWERYTQAAARCGIPPRAFLELVNHDPLMRVQRLGKRQLLHVPANDVEALAMRLQQGGV